jgi:hypothetical protein
VSPYRVPASVDPPRGPRWGVTPTKRMKYHWRRFVMAVLGGWDDEMWPLYRKIHRMRIENERMQRRLASMKFDLDDAAAVLATQHKSNERKDDAG